MAKLGQLPSVGDAISLELASSIPLTRSLLRLSFGRRAGWPPGDTFVVHRLDGRTSPRLALAVSASQEGAGGEKDSERPPQPWNNDRHAYSGPRSGKEDLCLMPSHSGASRPRVLSLAQPTADSLHLGNFLGALRQWVPLQEDHEAFYGIADLHALTKHDRASGIASAPCVLPRSLAPGIDPAKATVFLQSVPEHTQLSWVLGCITGYGQAQRMTQFKDKAAKMGPEATNVGLFTYPVLMAADILLYQTDQVPVGEDQRQHLELTRDLAARFNSRYGPTFVVPEPYILPSVGRIADLAEPGTKMSKSLSSPTGIIESCWTIRRSTSARSNPPLPTRAGRSSLTRPTNQASPICWYVN